MRLSRNRSRLAKGEKKGREGLPAGFTSCSPLGPDTYLDSPAFGVYLVAISAQSAVKAAYG